MNLQQRKQPQHRQTNLSAHDRLVLAQLAQPVKMHASAKRPWVRAVARAIIALYVWQTALAIAPVYAQSAPRSAALSTLPIVAAPQAPAGQKPLIDAAANGVPVVLIAPPNAGGVSHNQYDQFNVGQSGLILNNSKTNVATQLGGIISGNLQFGTTQARIILNEVTSTNPSQLNGFIEVAGQKADIVIANPNGISCDGCGFINTAGRTTLTTGTPEIDGGGNINSLSVQRGIISVGAGGLNAGNLEQLDLLARGIVIEGEISTRNLKAILGSNKVLYGTLTATQQDGTGSAPKFAVDIAELGGMFANQVYLIANEKGLGVNSRGRIASLEENLVLSAQGDLTLKDSYSKKDIELTSTGAVTLTGQTSGNDIKVVAPERFTNSSTALLRAEQQVLFTTKKIDNSGTIVQKSLDHALTLSADDGINNSGIIYSATDLNLQSKTIKGANGILQAENALNVQANGIDGVIDFSGQQLFANKDLTVQAGSIVAKQSVVHADRVTLNASKALNADHAEISAAQDVALSGATINADDSVIIGGAGVAINSAGLSLNGAQISAGTDLSMTGASVQARQAQLVARHTVALSASGTLDLGASQVAADNAIILQGAGISTAGAAIVAPQVSLNAGAGKLDNSAGLLYGNSGLDITAAGINNNSGQIGAGNNLTLDAQGGAIDNTSGLISAPTSVFRNVSGLVNRGGSLYTSSDLDLGGAFDNQNGKIVTDGALRINGSAIDNSGGTLQARSAVELIADMVNNAGGVIQSTGSSVSVQAGTLNNLGAFIGAGSDVKVKVSDLQNIAGEISANGNVDIDAASIASADGRIGAGGKLKIKAGAVSMDGAKFGSNDVFTLDAGDVSADHAQLQSGSSMTLTIGKLSANDAQFAAGKDIKLTVAGDAALNNAVFAGAGNVDIASQNLAAKNLQADSNKTLTIAANNTDLQGAQLSGITGVGVSSADLNLQDGKVTSGKDLSITAGSQKGGSLSAQGNLDVTLQNGLDLTGGALIAGQAVSVKAQGIVTDQAKVNGNQVTLDAGNQSLSNRGGQIVAEATGATTGPALAIDANGIDNRGGILYSGADALFNAKGNVLDNSGGSIGVVGAMQVNASVLRNRAGSIASGSSISLIGQELDNSQGQLQSGADILIDTQGKLLNNNSGLIQAQGKLTLSASQMSNVAGNFAANKNVDLSAQSLDNTGGGIASGQALTIQVAGAVDSNNSIIKAGGPLSLTAQKLSASQSTIATQGTLTLDVQQALTLDQSDIQAEAAIKFSSDKLAANAASIKTNGEINLIARQDISLNGSGLSAIGSIAVTAKTALSLQLAQLATNAELSLTGSAIGAAQSDLTSGKDMRLLATSGSIALDGSGLISGGALQINGLGISADYAAIAAQNNILIDTHGGNYQADGSVHRSQSGGIAVNANDLHAAGSTATVNGFLAQDDIALTAGGLIDVSNSVVSSGKNIALAAKDGINNASGQIVAGASATLSGSSINNASGVIDASDALRISARQGGIDNTIGSVTTRGQLTLETVSGLNRKAGLPDASGGATELNNFGGNIIGLAGVAISSGALDNRQGKIASGGNLAIATGDTAFSGANGALLSNGAMTLSAGNIDVSLGQVRAGLGINLTGRQIHAQGSDFSTAGGDLLLDAKGGSFDADNADIQSAAALSIKAGATNLAQASLASVGTTSLQIAALDARQALINAGGNIAIASSAAINTVNANVAANGTLDLSATALQGGQYSAIGNLSVSTAGSVDISQGALISDAVLDVKAQGITLDQGKAIGSRVKLDAGTAALSNQQGLILATDNSAIPNALQLSSQGLNNSRGSISSNGDLVIAAGSAKLDNQDGSIGASGKLNIGAGDINNKASSIVANQSVTIQSQNFDNHSGSVQAGAALSIKAANVDNGNGALIGVTGIDLVGANLDNSGNALIASNGNISLTTTAVNNNDSRVSAGGNLAIITTGAISNRNAILEADGDSKLASGGGIDSTAGRITAGGQITAQSNGAFANDRGHVNAGTSLAISAGGAIGNHSGAIATGTDASLIAGAGLNNDNGSIVANGALAIAAQSLTTKGALIAAGTDLSIDTKTLGGAIDNQGGQIQASGKAGIAAQGINNQSAIIIAGQDFNLDAGNGLLDNRSGALQSVAGSIDIKAGDINNAGANSAIIATKNVSIVSNSGVDNQQAWISAGQSVNVAAGGAIDNSKLGAIGAGKDIAIIAQGAINNAQGSITAGGNNLVQGAGIANQDALISARSALTLQAGTGLLDNSNGQLLAGTTLSARATGVANQGGAIAANDDLMLQTDNSGNGGASGKLDNTAGLIRSAQGSVVIGSGDLLNQRADPLVADSNGQIRSAKDITINAHGAIDNSNSAIVAPGNLKITADGAIDNSNARMAGLTSLDVSANGINSTDGVIASNGKLTVNAGTGALDNTRGLISGGLDTIVNSGGVFTNDHGTLESGANLTTKTGAVNNRNGVISAQGIADLTSGAFDNQSGQVIGAAALLINTQGQSFDNTLGTFGSNGDITLKTGHATLTGSTISSGKSFSITGTAIDADNVSISAQDNISLLSGIGASDLSLNRSDLEAGKAITLSGKSVGLRGSIVAANGDIRIDGTDIDAANANIGSQNDVTINAGNTLSYHAAQLIAARDLSVVGAGSVDTSGATLKAGRNLTLGFGQQFAFNATDFSYQFGNDLAIHANGITTSGVAVAGNNLTLDAGTGILDNRSGSIVASGTLTLSGNGIINQNTSIVANKAVTIDAGSGPLDNSKGTIGSVEGSVSIHAGDLDNTDGGSITAIGAIDISATALHNSTGTIAANGAVSISSSTLTNTGGTLVSNNSNLSISGGSINNANSTISAGKQLNINDNGSLNNNGGQLIAGSSASIVAGSVNNGGGTIAGSGTVGVTSLTGTLNNAGGIIQSATGSATAYAAHGDVDNRNGQIYGAASSVANAGGTLHNGGGRIASNGAVSATGQTVSNGGGVISGGTGVTVSGGDINNAGGVISGLGSVAVSGNTVNNDAGVIESGSGGISISAANLSNNYSGASRGIVSQGSIYISGGSISQIGGYIGANGTLTISGGDISNTGGSIMLGLGGVALNASNTFDNQGGNAKSGKGLTLTAGSVNNIGGVVFATENLTVTAAAIDNSDTKNGNYDKGLLAGGNLTLSGATINNNNGAIVALGDLTATATTSITNLGGQFAANNLTIDTPDFTNTGGRVDATTRLTSKARKFSADGILASSGTLAITMDGDYTNTGTVAASGSLDITLNGGKYTNNGTVSSTEDLLLKATGLDNTSIITSKNTTIDVGGGTINNSGSINSTLSGTTTINAGTTNNSGQIYGGIVNVSGTVNNLVNATVASRGDLTMNGSILNAPGANILSLGNMSLGNVVNAGATIQAGGDINIGSLDNLNCSATSLGGNGADASGCAAHGFYAGVTLKQQTTTKTVNELTIFPDNTTIGYIAGTEVIYSSADNGHYYFVSTGADIGTQNWHEQLVITRATDETVTADSNPGQVLAGGNITGGATRNIDSRIIGQDVTIGGGDSVNQSTKGTREVTDDGTYLWNHIESCGFFGGDCREQRNKTTYHKVVSGQSDVDAVQYKKGGIGAPSSPTGTDPVVAPLADVPTKLGISAIGAAGADNGNTSGLGSVAAQAAGVAHGVVSGSAGSGVSVGTVTPDLRTVNANPSQGVTTDTNGLAVEATVATKGVGQIATESADFHGTTTTVIADPNKPGTKVGLVTSTIDHINDPAVSNTGVSNVLPGSVIAGELRPLQQAAIDSVTTQFAKIAAARPVTAKENKYNGTGNGADMKTVGQGSVNGKTAPDVTLTANTSWKAPSGNLFSLHAKDGASYLVETDPLFTDGRQWIGSDYFLAQLNLDPERTMKRYGDGFVEQRAFADQLISITGRNTLSGYADNQQAFAALMDAGVAYAKEFHLTPGVALSDQQMALLTTDIVWLQAETVTLPDGTTTQALVPQVYLRRPQQGDLATGGALIAGNNVTIRNKDGDITNSGTILAGYANAKPGDAQGALVLDAVNVVNKGTIAGNVIDIKASTDIKNIGGHIVGLSSASGGNGDAAVATPLGGNDSVIQLTAGRDITIASTTLSRSIHTAGGNGGSTSSATTIDRIATISGGNVRIDAAGNFTAKAAQVSADNQLVLLAGKDIDISSIAESRTLDIVPGSVTNQGRTAYFKEASTANVASNFSAGSNALIMAKGDATIGGSNIKAGVDATIVGANVSISAATDRKMIDIQSVDAGAYSRAMTDNESLAGGNINAGGKLLVVATGVASGKQDADGKPIIQAGTGNLNIKGASLASGAGSNVLVANNDINIVNLSTLHNSLNERYSKNSNLVSTKTSASSNSTQVSLVEGSIVTGNTVQINAGHDAQVRGSDIAGVQDVAVQAGNNVTIASAQDSYRNQQSHQQTASGLTASYSAGTASIGFGKSSSSGQASVDAISQHGASIESTSGNTRIQAGQQLTVVASDLGAGKNLTLIGASVDLSAAQDTSVEHSAQQSKSSGFSVGVTLDPLAAFKTAYKDSGKDNKTTSTVGRTLKRDEAIADGVLAATTVVVVQAGSRSANATQDHATSTARVSTLTAGGDLAILATGGSITSQGTSMSAEGDALLIAKDNITLDVAHNLESQGQDNKARGWSLDNRGSLPVGVFNNKGNGLGSTDTIAGSSLSVGGKATLATTEGDITITGSNVVATGDTTINAARNLTIQSGQDTVANDNHSNNRAIGKVVISDTERFAGYHNEKHNDAKDGVTQVDANVASLQGNVTLTAGGNYTQTASNVLAGNDVSITAKTIDIGTAANSGTSAQDTSDLKIGMFARISSPLIDLVNNVEAAGKSDGRLRTMQGMAAAANGYQVASAVTGGGVLIKGEVGVGFASAKSKDAADYSQAQGSTITGGNNVSLTSTEGDIHATGSNIAAGKVLTLDSARDILLDAGQSTAHSTGDNHSAGLEVGVGYSVGAQTGVYAYVAANAGHGDYNNTATTNSNTHLAGDTVTLHSKGDTTLQGADVKAGTINAAIGGKLAIESVQDTGTQHNQQSNTGVRLQVSFGTAWEVSGNTAQSKANGSRIAVGEQSGLFAGDGGYHVTADTIALKGGAIGSMNAGNSTLTTNAITFENLDNKMDYKATSASISGGFGGASTNADGSSGHGVQSQNYGGAGNPNISAGLPMQDKGSAHSSTYATLTDGNLTIGGKTMTSAKELGAHTDLSTANQGIAPLPDLRAIIGDQKATAAAAGTIIATSGQIANDIAAAAGKQQKDAQAVLDDRTSTPEQREQAQKTINDAQQTQANWGTTGDYRRGLTVVTGILVGSAAGQGLGQIAANATAPYAAQAIGDYFTQPGHENQTAQVLTHAVLGGILAAANGGNAIGGAGAGAAGELAAQVISRELYPKELYPQAYDADGGFHPEKLTAQQTNTVIALSTGIGALVAGMTGGSMMDASIGANIASNAATNNYLRHGEVDQLLLAQAQCKTDPAACKVAEALRQRSIARDRAIQNCSATGTCLQWLAEVQADSADLGQAIKLNDAARSNVYDQLQKTGTVSPLSITLVERDQVLRDQFTDMNNVFAMGGYSQLFTKARTEYYDQNPNATFLDFNRKFGYNQQGLTVAGVSLMGGMASGGGARGRIGTADEAVGAKAVTTVGELTTTERAAGGTLIEINPADLRWTQRTAGGNGRADTMRTSMSENGYAGPPIDVVQTADGIVTVDHTRAAVALEQGIPSIPATLHLPTDLLPADMAGRFGTATTWGEAAAYRAGRQTPPLPPTGTPTAPKLPSPKNGG